ncbi:MAG: hypothetical protein WKF65_14760 [Gaiellaceae bacterium]
MTPSHPDCNYIDIMQQHLILLRRGESILKPVYGHADGKFGPPKYVKPKAFTVVEGLLGYHTEEMRNVCDVRVFLAPPEELRRRWKVNRDCTKRGYTTDQVLAELDKREDDSVSFIRPQERYADLVVSFTSSSDRNPDHLDAELTLRDGLPNPDLSPFTDSDGGITLREQDGERLLLIPGQLDTERAGAIEHAIWDQMQFASHLRSQSDRTVALGGDDVRSDTRDADAAPPILEPATGGIAQSA